MNIAKYPKYLAFLMIAAVAGTPLACGDSGDERAALENEELERELDMALGRDSAVTSFEDTAVTARDEADPPAAEPRREAERAPRDPAPRPSAPQPAPARRTVTLTVPAATTFAIRLNETLSTETNEVGDTFTGALEAPIVSADGVEIIPAGAMVRGRVTGVKKSGRVGETAVIKLAFEAISFDGESHPLSASVESANTERRTRTSTAETAGKIAVGAAAGAILGQVIGKDTESTLKGAAIGAAAGTAIAMGTADVDAVLPEGSRMVIRLDEAIVVEREVRVAG